jgi:hypothetical protein
VGDVGADVGRTAAPSAVIIDSRSVRAAPTVATSARGHNTGKKVQGRERDGVDTLGLLVAVLVTPAERERDGVWCEVATSTTWMSGQFGRM